MAETRPLDIRVVIDDENGDPFWSNYEAYDLENFGGVLPSVGDTIVNPGVMKGMDRLDPTHREVQEIVARYFQPSTDPRQTPFAVLVVRRRVGTEQEAIALGS